MPYKWNDEHTMKFLEAFREQECLWNDRCDDYKNWDERSRAVQAMIRDLGIPCLVPGDIKLKIKTIRTRYAGELAKIKKSNESGGTYVPTLYWFALADSFLNHAVRPRLSFYSSKGLTGATSGDSETYSSPMSRTRLKRRASEDDEYKEEAVEYIDFDEPSPTVDLQEDIQINSRHNIMDEYEAVGINVAAKLRRMEATQAIYAEMIINKTITCGLLNKLSCNTDLSD